MSINMPKIYEITEKIKINETIECLSDIVSLLLSLKGCIDTAADGLLYGHFDFIHFIITYEEIRSDWKDLMSIYSDSEWVDCDLEFEFRNFIAIWTGILMVFTGHSLDWCLRHPMIIMQLLVRVKETQSKYESELRRLKKLQQKGYK